MADRAHAAEVIADRYLTSPSRLAARPYGPIDALDTHSGRAAQVRIVFVSSRWQEPELADAVARWCAIGVSGVCGVLDFGRHADRWFLVLPPSLGTPVERWRSMRRPSAVDAAALALAFGRLLEAVQAAGFDAGSAVVSDFAVGPGPTPFLEQPLLASPAAASINRRSGGQSVLAALFAAAAAEDGPPPELAAWRQAAQDAAHPSLGVCLDALERAAAACRAAGPEPPVGLAGVFDGPYTPPAAPPWATWARRIAGPLAIALATAGAAGALLLGRQPHRSAAPPPPARAHLGAAPKPVQPVHRSPSPPAAVPRRPKHHTAKHPARRAAHRRHPSAAKHQTAAVAASPSTAARPPARSTATPPATITLPTPGGTVLPAP